MTDATAAGMHPVYLEINRWLAQPFDWATMNCAFAACDWVLRATGRDPAEADRMTFDDMAGCARATGYFRDPVGTVADRMERAGFRRGNALRTGDLGVLRLPDLRHPVVGVWTGTSWAVKAPEGATTRAPALVTVLAFWNVCDAP